MLCVTKEGNECSVIYGKIYQVIRPEKNDQATDVRVIDEEGEDYLYPADYFAEVTMSPEAKRRYTPARKR